MMPCAAGPALAALLLCSPLQAKANHPMVGGFGLESCVEWTAYRGRKSPLTLVFEQWVLAFLSGVGFAAPGDVDPLAGTNAEAVG